MPAQPPLAERIELVLKNEHLDPGELAAIAKTSSATVSQWRSGATNTMKGTCAFAIAKRYGYNPEWLMYGDGPVKTEYSPAAQQILKTLQAMCPSQQYQAARIVSALLDKDAGNIAA